MDENDKITASASLIKPRPEQTCLCHMQKQRRRGALISAFVVRCLGNIIPLVAIYEISSPNSLCDYVGWFESTLVANPEDRFSRDVAHM